VKVIDPPSENRWPGKLVIGRAYMPDEESNRLVAQGASGAEHWFRFLRPYVARATYVHAWEGPNEPQPVADFGFATALGQFTGRLAELMHAAGLKVIGGCLSEGNPGGDEAQAKACYVAIAKGLAACDYEGFHCYWVMGYSHPEAGMNDWHAFRYRRNRRYAAEAGIALPPLLITECGVDGGVVGLPKRGWMTFCPSKSVYMEQLRQFDTGLAADPYVLAATVFTSGPTGDWSDFEVDQGLSRMIDEHILAQGGAYRPGNSSGSLVEALRIEFGQEFEDLTGSLPRHATERYSKRPLSDINKVVIHHTETARSTTWQSVASFHVNSRGWPGIAYHIGIRQYNGVLRVSLLNPPETRSYHAHTEGNDHGLAVCIAGSFGSIEPLPSEIDAARRVVAVVRNFLGRNVDVVGHKDVIGNDTSCPGAKLAARLGEIGGEGSLSLALRTAVAEHQVLKLNPAAALQKAIFAAGFVPTSAEFDIVFGGVNYRCQSSENLETGAVRCYLCVIPNWDNAEYVEWNS
jgi:hypothetical protein